MVKHCWKKEIHT